jgi:cephalosporin hydroxylase
MSDEAIFKQQCEQEVAAMGRNEQLRSLSRDWISVAQEAKYSYHFRWLGRPIIQYPQDIVALQEIIWDVRPNLIIETGVARGGSLIFSASMLALLDLCSQSNGEEKLRAAPATSRVVGVDIDIRSHNRRAIEEHPLSSRITLIEGSSIDGTVVSQVRAISQKHDRVLVCLDSNHTHAHVQEELEKYAAFTTVGSYCIVFDTIIEDLPASAIGDRPWGPGNSPKTAVQDFLTNHPEFVVDHGIDSKLLVSVARNGYLRRAGPPL